MAGLQQALSDQTGQLNNYRQSLRTSASTELMAMAQVMRSRDIFGVKSHKDIHAEIEKTKAAYKTLVQSGTLSAKAQAWVAMRDKVRDLKNETNGWLSKVMEAKVAIVAASGTFIGVYRAIKGAISGAIEYERSFAEVKANVRGTPEQLNALSSEIVALAGQRLEEMV